MKRYLLFCGHYYIGQGGWYGCHGDYDTIEEAVKYTEENGYNTFAHWYHIVDTEIKEIVRERNEIRKANRQTSGE